MMGVVKKWSDSKRRQLQGWSGRVPEAPSVVELGGNFRH